MIISKQTKNYLHNIKETEMQKQRNKTKYASITIVLNVDDKIIITSRHTLYDSCIRAFDNIKLKILGKRKPL